MMTGGVDSQDFGGGGRGTLFLLSAKLFFAPNSMVRKKVREPNTVSAPSQRYGIQASRIDLRGAEQWNYSILVNRPIKGSSNPSHPERFAEFHKVRYRQSCPSSVPQSTAMIRYRYLNPDLFFYFFNPNIPVVLVLYIRAGRYRYLQVIPTSMKYRRLSLCF